MQVTDPITSDIAIIGMSCRFPGARHPDQFWENLVAGRVSIGEVPAARWRWQDYRADSQCSESSSYCRWGGFIDDVDAFDPGFFSISAREAESMDPQQRLGLEGAWACFEDAAVRPSNLSGRNVGVFLGFTNLDYKEIMELLPIDIYYATGTLSSVIPNRISHFFNLRGPSMAVDTACSSSLYAIHLACRSLQANECEMALTGGISLLLTPKRFLWYGKAGILSPTGTLRTFDEKADGTVRGEGAGFILLKPLVRAITDGNRILGVIKGSAVNHGGKNPTLTYPSPTAQAEVIVHALQSASVKPSAISYVEAHGTGTVKGDPIEVQGLVQAFQSDSGASQGQNGNAPWCGLGSVKPNIGHLEGAAGIAGIIKVLLAFRHKMLPPLANFTNVNSRIALGSAFYFADHLQAWEPCVLPRIAGVSSFGFAGTNAHVIVAEAPTTDKKGLPCVSQRPFVVVLSAKDSERLKERARELLQTVAQQGWSDADLEALAFTLQVGREAMHRRMAMRVRSLKELEEKLEQFVENKHDIEGLYVGEVNEQTGLPAAGDEEPLQQGIGQWEHEGTWSKLLKRWVNGTGLDWQRLYGEPKPRPLSLPTYPFARERYWISHPAESFAGVAERAHLHPLVQVNTSNLAEQRFSSIFTGQEFFFADHRIQGRPVLPAAAYLEMVREAVTRAAVRSGKNGEQWAQAIALQNLVWLRPVVGGNAPVEVHIGLFPTDKREIAFEVYSGSGPAEKVVHSQGVAVTGPITEPLRVNVERLATQYQQSRHLASACYAKLAGFGMEYGDAHRGLEGLYVQGSEVVARLCLPESRSFDRFMLHPALIDSGLQAIIGFALSPEAMMGEDATFLPFEVQNVEVYSSTAPRMWAVVRRVSAPRETAVRSYDIDFCDEAGRVCVRLNGFSTRSIDSKRAEFKQDAGHTQRTSASTRFERPIKAEAGGNEKERKGPHFSRELPEASARAESAHSVAINATSGMWARVLRKKEECDLELSDEYGRVSVLFRGWTARPLQSELRPAISVEAPVGGEAVLMPVWEPFSIERDITQSSESVALIGGTSDERLAVEKIYLDVKFVEVAADESIDSLSKKIAALGAIGHLVWIVPPHVPDHLAAESVITEQSRGVILGFRLVKALLAVGYGDRPFTWTVVTTGVEAVHPHQRANPTHASVHGLMGSVANEYAGWKVRLMDLPESGDRPWDEVFAIEPAARGNVSVYRAGRWYRQQLLPYRLPNDAPAAGRSEEVYVMVGGHGGIAAAWSEILMRQSRVQLVWIGRRLIDDVIQARIDRLAELGPTPVYISADATNREQLEHARSMILEKFGRIDGLVHAAMVLQDGSLLNMTEDSFTAALRPKVDGCVRLAQVFAGDALRFVLFFSSWNAFIKSAGQSNYVAGCTFEDSFARRMAEEWPARVRVINWGYWGTVGAAASDHYHSLMARKGLGSIETPDGSRILDELLCARVLQMAYLRRSGRVALQDCNVRSDEWTASFRETLPSCLSAAISTSAGATEWFPPAAWSSMKQEIEAMALDLLWFQLQAAGLVGGRDLSFDFAQSTERVKASLRPWFERSICLLEARGYLSGDGGKRSVSEAAPVDGVAAWKQWDSWKDQRRRDHEWAPSILLIDAVLRQLPDILTGQRASPEGLLAELLSSTAVANVVSSGPVVRFCADTIARIVIRYIEERRRQNPKCELRILEICAGTGGTTEAVFEAIQPYETCLREYTCTGISAPLLSVAKKRLPSERRYLTFQTFDVARAADAQGIPLDAYDLVIASNVLHTTKEVCRSLRNAKAVLKANGLLILHELTYNSMISHLTASLLDASSVFADIDLRIPGGSALLPETWKTVLEEEGFNSVVFPAEKVHNYGHQVAVAESDGVIRQCLSPASFLAAQKDVPNKEPGGVVEARAAEVDRPAGIDEIMSGPRDVAVAYLLSSLRLRTAETLGVCAASLDSRSRPFADMLLAELGMDSLSSNDLRNTLRQEFGVDIPVQRIIGDKVNRIVDSLYDELLIRRISGAGSTGGSVDRETYVF